MNILITVLYLRLIIMTLFSLSYSYPHIGSGIIAFDRFAGSGIFGKEQEGREGGTDERV